MATQEVAGSIVSLAAAVKMYCRVAPTQDHSTAPNHGSGPAGAMLISLAQEIGAKLARVSDCLTRLSDWVHSLLYTGPAFGSTASLEAFRMQHACLLPAFAVTVAAALYLE